jgi:hypothetical protein
VDHTIRFECAPAQSSAVATAPLKPADAARSVVELDGEDLRGAPLEGRKRTLAKLVRGPHSGIVLSERCDGDNIVARLQIRLRGRRAKARLASSLADPARLKVKNPAAPGARFEPAAQSR